MKEFDFLTASPFYVKTKNFYKSRHYYFEDSFTKKTAEIQIPFYHRFEIDFDFDRCEFIEETPNWFHMLFLQAKKACENRNRIRRLFDSPTNHLIWVVSPALQMNECQVSKEILCTLNEDFSMDDTLEETKEKLSHYEIQIKHKISDVTWKTFTPLLWRYNQVALHPLSSNQGGFILTSDEYPKIQLIHK